MKKWILFSILAMLLFSCKEEKKPGLAIKARDTSITMANSVTELFFDSTSMESFIAQQGIGDSLAGRIRSFYNSRNYQYAWFDSAGIVEHAQSFLNMQSQYIDYARDSSIYDPFLHQLLDTIMVDSTLYRPKSTERLRTELELTEGFFKYADKAYQGSSSVNTTDLGWFIPRKKVNMVRLLDSVIANNSKGLSDFEPVSRQYNLLKGFLFKYYEIEKNGGWTAIVADKKSYAPGDTSETIRNIKKRLSLTEDLTQGDTTAVYDTAMKTAIKNFQRRYGLKEDGVIGKGLIEEMNRPIRDRIQQLLINLERIRWAPDELPQEYLLVNIPAYKLFVYEKGVPAWSMDVVVGSTAHNTVIFRGDMKYVVFSPYWNVPPGILKSEVLPGIKKSSSYLARHNMEWNNGAVRQKPGPNNSLGLVKFLFPNSYNIYLHDTPAKSLFSESKRAFSHGCIRLGEPRKLAEYLLRNDPSWTSDRITRAMNSRKEQFVTLKQTIPVFIGYFTAWVDRDGKLNFRDDIYGHDRKMAAQLFTAKSK